MDISEEVSITQAVELISTYAGRCSRSTLYRWLGQLSIEPVGGYVSRDELTLLIIWGKAIYRIRDSAKAAKAVAALRRSKSPDEQAQFAFSPHSTFTKTLIQEIGQYAA